MTSLESGFQQDLNSDGLISSSAATIAGSGAMTVGQLAEALHNESAFDVVHFFGESNVDGWHFKSFAQSGRAGIFGPEGFFPNSVGSPLLTELLNDAQASHHQSPTFVTANDAHDTLVNLDSSMLAKALVADLHTGFLIAH